MTGLQEKARLVEIEIGVDHQDRHGGAFKGKLVQRRN